jgi:4'-phosphopantetheinyl transferase
MHTAEFCGHQSAPPPPRKSTLSFFPEPNSSPAFVVTTREVPSARTAGVEVLCVTIDLLSSLNAGSFAALSDEDRRRAARFLRREDALRHAAGRAALRNVLGERLGVVPSELTFTRDARGRPRLAEGECPNQHAKLDFNISHAGSYALIALAEGRRVGVDIEKFHPNSDWDTLTTVVFSPSEAVHVASLPEDLRCNAFYDTWTAKEALLKALGTGLSAGMTHISVLGEKGQVPVEGSSSKFAASPTLWVNGMSGFAASWCPAPAGYTACVAWSLDSA